MKPLWAVVACVAVGWSQPTCSVREELRVRTQTARFTLGPVAATITLPYGLFESDPPAVFVEVQGDPASLFLSSGEEIIPLRHGAAIRLQPNPAERHRLTILTSDHVPLCSWQPHMRRAWRPARPSAHPDTFDNAEPWILRRTGDPLILDAGGVRHRTFQIAGEPAMVLARTSFDVILRDPHPAAGLRTVESEGFTVNLRFFDADLRVTRHALTIRAPDLPLATADRLWPHDLPLRSGLYGLPILSVFNFDPGARLRCGDPQRTEAYEHASIRITRAMLRSRSFEFTCPIQASDVPADLDFLIVDPPFYSHGAPLSVIPHIPR